MLKLRIKYDAESAAQYFDDSSGLSTREMKGRWLGAGCSEFGVEPLSPVSKEQLSRGLEGLDLNGRTLYQRLRKNRRCGWDTVFAPDKSVSISSLCLPENESKRIYESFTSVAAPLTRLMEHLTQRSDYYSGQPTPTRNLTVANFTHEASRYNDPHIHLHLLFLNATWDASVSRRANKWKAVEPKLIYSLHSLLDQLAHREVARTLHLAGFAPRLENGVCSLPIPRALCDRLSKGHFAILEAANRLNPPSSPNKPPLSRQKWLNYVNDRIRPSKTPAHKRPDFSQLLHDRTELAERIIRNGASTLETHVPKEVEWPELLERDLFENSVHWSVKDRWTSVSRVATHFPFIPLEPLIDLATRIKQPAPFFPSGFDPSENAKQIAEFEGTRLRPPSPGRRTRIHPSQSDNESISP